MLSPRSAPTRTARRFAAAAAGTAMVLTGAVTALAPTAQAGTVTPILACDLPSPQADTEGPQQIDVTFDPVVAQPGQTVTAHVTLGPGTPTSPMAMTVKVTPTIDFQMSGAATGTVTVRGPQSEVKIEANKPIPTPPFSGTFNLPATAQGPISFTPIRTLTYTTGVPIVGSTETPCNVVSGSGVVGTVTALGDPGTPSTLDAPTTPLRPGTAVPLSGALWTPSATPVPSLCDAGGGSCDPGKFTANNLTLDAGGNLSGTATLAGTVANGSYVLKVNDGAKEASANVTVKAYVPEGPAEISLSRSRGPVGTEVTVTGKNFNANKTLTVTQLDSQGFRIGTAKRATTSAEGTFVAPITVNFDATVAISAIEPGLGGLTAQLPFTIANDPPTAALSTTTSRPGGTINVTGANWAPNSPVTAELCAADGTDCQASRLSSGPLTADAQGNINGAVTLASNVGDGAFALKLSDGSGSVSTPVTVNKRWLELDKTSGKTGTMVKVTGHGYGKSAWITLNGLAGDSKTSDWAGAWADPSGNFCIYILITKSNTTGIIAAETFHPSRNASTPFTITN